MEITVKGTADEIAALVLGVQGRREGVDDPIDTITKAVINTVNHMARDSGKHTLHV